MKEAYISPSVELVLLRADSQLASNNGFELDFDDFFTTPGGDTIIDDGKKPVESNPDIDIDIPLG